MRGATLAGSCTGISLPSEVLCDQTHHRQDCGRVSHIKSKQLNR